MVDLLNHFRSDTSSCIQRVFDDPKRWKKGIPFPFRFEGSQLYCDVRSGLQPTAIAMASNSLVLASDNESSGPESFTLGRATGPRRSPDLHRSARCAEHPEEPATYFCASTGDWRLLDWLTGWEGVHHVPTYSILSSGRSSRMFQM